LHGAIAENENLHSTALRTDSAQCHQLTILAPHMKILSSLLRFLAVATSLTQILCAAPEHPNIVLLFADDLGINDIGVYGRKEHSTPNLDKLASEGKRFTTAYSAASICSPSRAALLTGQSPARLQITNFLPGRKDWPGHRLIQPALPGGLASDRPIIAERLKEAGYSTACVGKWHLGSPPLDAASRGFDFVFAGRSNTTPTANEGGKGEFAQTAKAIEFIESNAKHPFFLYFAFDNPHVPLAAQPNRVAAKSHTFNPIYAAMIETLDTAIGQILGKLEALHLKEKTIVIFCSDNGGLHVPETPNTPATHNGPHRAGKGFLYEGGIRSPLIIRWPQKITPGTVGTPVVHGDLAPTLIEYAGAAPILPSDYTSIAPLLTGGGSMTARPLYWHMPHYTNQGGRPSGAIREEDWKLVEQFEDGALELYNLKDDVSEEHNLAASEPARVAAMRGKLEEWRRGVGASMPRANTFFQPLLWEACYQTKDVSVVTPLPNAAETARTMLDWRHAMDQIRIIPNEPSANSGLIHLEPKDAFLHANKLRYEPQANKDTLGYWVDPSDWAEWECEIIQPGRYAIEILQACAKGGSIVEVQVGRTSTQFNVEDTGHFQRFIPRRIGIVELPAGKTNVAVRPMEKRGGAIMDLRRLSLVRVP
jgi:arylsulfatase A-like enzyme